MPTILDFLNLLFHVRQKSVLVEEFEDFLCVGKVSVVDHGHLVSEVGQHRELLVERVLLG